MAEWKENITLIIAGATLMVTIVTLIVAICSYKYTKESEKKRLKNILENKEAQLKSFNGNIKYIADDSVKTTAVMLEAEIKQLKQQLKDYE